MTAFLNKTRDDQLDELTGLLSELYPNHSVRPRCPFSGGYSGAEVWLVDLIDDVGNRLGVVKLGSEESIRMEVDGYKLIRDSWMGRFLPDRSYVSEGLDSRGRRGLLITLAKKRVDASYQLGKLIEQQFYYGSKYLSAIAFAYRQQAQSQWKSSPAVTDVGRTIVGLATHQIKDGWYEGWVEAGLPDRDHASLAVEDRAERWPNPIAYVLNPELFAGLPPQSFAVPHIRSHGDLNPQNVLTPNPQRVVTIQLGGSNGEERVDDLLKQISIIDPPFTIEAPFTHDPAFLTACLHRVLLPRFESQTSVDITLNAYNRLTAWIQAIDDTAELSVHRETQQFADCVSRVWTQLLHANTEKPEDVRTAFFVSLIGASVWQAIKVFKNDRSLAASKICHAAIVLRTLLGAEERVPQPTFFLQTGSKGRSCGGWTETAREIGLMVRDNESSSPLVLVLGSEWDKHKAVTSLDEATELTKLSTFELQDALAKKPSNGAEADLESIGEISPSMVIDFTVDDAIRDAVQRSARIGGRVVAPLPRDLSNAVCAPEDTLWLRMRGSLQAAGTLATTPKMRADHRRNYRPIIRQFAKKRGATPTILMVGATPSEVTKLMTNYLDDIWDYSFKGMCVGEWSPEELDGHSEVDLRFINGTLQDFLSACKEVRSEEPPAETPQDELDASRTLRITGLSVENGGEGGFVIDRDAVSPVSITVDDDNYDAITSVGELLIWENTTTHYETVHRDATMFFLGHRVLMSEIHQGVAIERTLASVYHDAILDKLGSPYPQIFTIPSRPGAGASTLLRTLAYDFAYKQHLPVLILSESNVRSFEAIERMHRLVQRSFLVVCDPADIPEDQVRMLQLRCAPSRLPIVFVTSERVRGGQTISEPRQARDPKTGRIAEAKGDSDTLPILGVRLDRADTDADQGEANAAAPNLVDEHREFLRTLVVNCPEVDVWRLGNAQAQSFFLLTLEAFGKERIEVEQYVEAAMAQGDDLGRQCVAAIAFFSRFAYLDTSRELLSIVFQLDGDQVDAALSPFEQLLVIQSEHGWACRHEELSLRILQMHLAKGADSKDAYRYRLAEFVESVLLRNVEPEMAGYDIVANYTWALINPRSQKSYDGGDTGSLLMQTVPNDSLKRMIYQAAFERFKNHVNIISHYGKYLSRGENDFREAERILTIALDLEPKNCAVLHMLGMRYKDEIEQVLTNLPAHSKRSAEDATRINNLYEAAHEFFDQARNIEIGSEYNYSTPIQLDARMIRDELDRLEIGANFEKRVEALADPRVAKLTGHANQLIAEGARYLEPDRSGRVYYNKAREEIRTLRGDLDGAILSLTRHVGQCNVEHRPMLSVQLARYLVERGEGEWKDGRRDQALKDFKKAENYLSYALEDSTQRVNIRLWYNSARYLAHLTRNSLLQKLEEFYNSHPESLDGAFLLMCLYFCEAMEKKSNAAWRQFEKMQADSSRMSSSLGVLRAIREWLVCVQTGHGKEYRIFPNNLYREDREAGGKHEVNDMGRERLKGRIHRVKSTTEAYVKIDVCGFDIYFQPRAAGQAYHESDEGKRVNFLVAFTYEKPRAFDVQLASDAN